MHIAHTSHLSHASHRALAQYADLLQAKMSKAREEQAGGGGGGGCGQGEAAGGAEKAAAGGSEPTTTARRGSGSHSDLITPLADHQPAPAGGGRRPLTASMGRPGPGGPATAPGGAGAEMAVNEELREEEAGEAPVPAGGPRQP